MFLSILEIGSFDIINLIITIISIVVGLPGLVGAILLIIKRLNVKQFYKALNSTLGIKKHSIDDYHFKHYVKHNFTLESWCSSQEDISYKDFIKQVSDTKIILLTGSAGIGKSILMQKLATQFRSKLQKDKSGKYLKDYGILFYKLNRQSNLEKILNNVKEEIKNSSVLYNLYLDGLDEIDELSIRSGCEVLNDLLSKLLTDIAPNCDKIFISLRPEILDIGYSITQHIQEKDNILVFKIQNFNEKQIISMFNHEKNKTTSKERKNNFKKLKSIIKNNLTSVFTYPLILTWANELLSECDIKELTYISWYDALGKVIDKELEREYGLYCDSKGAVISPTEYSKDEFVNDGKKFLSDIALNMALQNTQQVTKNAVLENAVVKKFNKEQNETTGHTFLTRRLLRYVDWSENLDSQPYFEFIHNTIYWRFVADALLNPNTPQNIRAQIILSEGNNNRPSPLLQYCHQGLWSIHKDNAFCYKDYLTYMRAVGNKVINCSTKNNNLPLEIVLSCFYGFHEVVFDYSLNFDFTRIKEFVENRKINLSNTSNLTDLSFLNNFGSNSFDVLDCTNSNIVKAEIPEYVKDIKFSKCTSLTDVSIPDSLLCIGNSAFNNCTALTNVVIPDNVTVIGVKAFANCTAIKSLTIGKSVKKISESAFENCTGLTELNFNATACNSLGKDNICVSYSSFQNVGSNENGITVNIGSNVTKIPAGLFNNDLFLHQSPIKIKQVNFTKNSVCECIRFNAFESCNFIEELTIPDTVKSIEYNAFCSCESLKKIYIGSGVENIKESFVANCKSLIDISVSKNNKCFKSIDGNLYSNDGKTLIKYAIGKQEHTFSIPDGVTKIGKAAFENCLLHKINIPNSVVDIEQDAFADCIYLEELKLPPDITKINVGTFKGCSSLKNITIPDKVQKIDFNDIYRTENSYIVITNPFYGCTSLTDINVPKNNIHFKSIDGNLYNKDGTKLILYTFGKTQKEFTIPNTVKVIGKGAFLNNKHISSINIPQGIKIIEEQAFRSCTSLTNFIIPNSVVRIEKHAFLSHIRPSSHSYSSLERITYNGTVEEWKKVENINGFGEKEFTEIVCNDGIVVLNEKI